MNTKQIKVKCPCCGAILAVRLQQNIESKNLRCPVCRESSPFRLFRTLEDRDRSSDDSTIYPTEKSNNNSVEKAVPNENENYILGELQVEIDEGATGREKMRLRLKPGKNIIGRKANESSADIMIPLPPECRKMSREHLLIEARKVSGKGFIHCVSLYKKQVNDTFINNEKLEYGDCIVLKNGDILRLPDAHIYFLIQDQDKTDI